MTDDKSKRDFRDRHRVSGEEDYEVQYFAERHGLTPDQVRELIRKHGNNREALEAAAAHIIGKDANGSRH